MNRQNIEQIIRDLFKQNYELYPENYSNYVPDAVETAKQTARGYWDMRTEEEEKRDQTAGVTLQDYETWVVYQLYQIEKESVN